MKKQCCEITDMETCAAMDHTGHFHWCKYHPSNSMARKIVKYCSTEPKTRQQIMWHLEYKSTRYMQVILKKLVDSGDLACENNYYFAGR